jgi:hypothetical protein
VDVSLKLPALVTVKEYQEFNRLPDLLRQLGVRQKIKHLELGCLQDNVGVMYVGKRPSRRTVAALLFKHKHFKHWARRDRQEFLKTGRFPEKA